VDWLVSGFDYGVRLAKGSARCSVPHLQWGLKSPNTFLLKADPAVEIRLELSGTLERAVAP